MENLKKQVLMALKDMGYAEYQLNELNPIIEATIKSTKEALNLNDIKSISAWEYKAVIENQSDSGDFRDESNYESQDEYFGL